MFALFLPFFSPPEVTHYILIKQALVYSVIIASNYWGNLSVLILISIPYSKTLKGSEIFKKKFGDIPN